MTTAMVVYKRPEPRKLTMDEQIREWQRRILKSVAVPAAILGVGRPSGLQR